MAELMITFIVAHFVGDYVCQSRHMAVTKREDTETCLVHCCIYCFWVLVFVGSHCPEHMTTRGMEVLVVLTYVSHFVIDRFGLTERWLMLLNERGLQGYKSTLPASKQTSLEAGFMALVYAVTDNTFHLLLFYIPLRLGVAQLGG